MSNSRLRLSKRDKWIRISLLAFVGLTVLLTVVANVTNYTFPVDGQSMTPTLHDGDRLLVSRIAYSFRGPQRGDIVVFTPPEGDRPYIKRVIATEGETVEIRSETDEPGSVQFDSFCPGECFVYVNGVKLDEPYTNEGPNYVRPMITVPQDHVYVLGDNRRNSDDSHIFGPILISSITGQAFFSSFSATNWGFLEGPSYPTIK